MISSRLFMVIDDATTIVITICFSFLNGSYLIIFAGIFYSVRETNASPCMYVNIIMFV